MSSPRSNIVLALLIALTFHALLAAALAFYLRHAPEPDELAKLDLTSVDLSFAETVEETSAAVASAPSAPADATPPPPEEAVPPPRTEQTPPTPDAERTPSAQDAILPQLTEPIEKVKIEVERRETRDEKPRETRDGQRETKVEKRREPRDEKPQEKKPPQPQAAPASASAPRQARVDAPPKPRRAIRPDYPRESRLRGEHGDVLLELDVAADGTVSAVRVLKSPGYPLLDEAAVKAARGARFSPAKTGGKPVASTVRLTLNFRLK